MKFNPYDYDYSYSEWVKIIDERIFNEAHRKIMKRKLLDGIAFDKIAEEVNLSTRYVQTVFDNELKRLVKFL